MSGVAVIRTLLAGNAAVTAIAPAASIVGGDVPLNASRPAIGVRQISSVPTNFISINDPNKLHTDRVQVSAFVDEARATGAGSAGYPLLVALMTAILAACPSQRGTVGGIAVRSITPDVEGPDLPIPDAPVLSRSRDFIVKWVGA